MGHKHSVRDTGAHFTIDQYTRQIKNDSANKTTIVQYDHNSEKLTFEMPLYIDGHAMTLCDLIEIHFINISTDGQNQNHGTYEVNDIKADGSKAIFTWLISQEATQFAGSLSFFIVFKCTENGVTVYRWGTEICKSLAISEGMNNGEAVLTEYPDILAQWKAQIFGASGDAVLAVETAEANALAAIEAAGESKKQAVLDSIPEEYGALSALADSNYRNKAGAIVLDAEGESIVVNDASEYPLQNLKVFGKSEQLKTTGAQLFDKDSAVTGMLEEDGTVTTDGAYLTSDFIPVLPNTAYYQTQKDSIRAKYYDADKNPLSETWDVQIATEATFTTFAKAYYLRVTVSVACANTYMLNVGTNGAEYEPYSGGVASPCPEYPQEINSVENPVVGVYGKNLISSYVDTAKTHNGVTFTPNEDGSITINGTATEAALFNMVTLYETTPVIRPGAEYVIGGATNVAAIQVYEWQGTWVQCTSTSSEKAFKLSDNASGVLIRYVINPGLTAGNITVYPMLRLASETDGTYEQGKTAQTFETSHILHGIPVSSGGNYTDENGQQWICDEVDLARGVYIQRIGIATVDGSEGWHESTFTDKINQFIVWWSNANFRNVICNKLPAITVAERETATGFVVFDDDQMRISFLADMGITTEELCKAWLQVNNLIIHYILKDPIETPLSDAEINAFKALCTNKPNTTILNDSGAYMAVEYVADTKAYIDNKIAEMMNA